MFNIITFVVLLCEGGFVALQNNFLWISCILEIKKTHLTMKTLCFTYFSYIFDLTISDEKLAIIHEEKVT